MSLASRTAEPLWRIGQHHCGAGPSDRPFEEQHEHQTIAIVRQGRFTYHGEHGRRLLETGSVLLGNAGAGYQCSHEDSTGDCCQVVHFSPAALDEAQSSLGRRRTPRFTGSVLPPLDRLAPVLAGMAHDPEGTAPELLSAVLAVQDDADLRIMEPTPREQRGLRAATALIEARLDEVMSLDELAAIAGMSRFHFLRCFRRVHGTTPYRYLLARRLALAAQELGGSHRPVAEIAFANGFGDLSTFNARFKAAFGVSPSAWRAKLRSHLSHRFG